MDADPEDAAVAEDDPSHDFGELDSSGAPKRHGQRDGIDRDAPAEQMSRQERDRFIAHIARLRVRLQHYEDDAKPASAAIASAAAVDLRPQLENLRHQLAEARSELRVAEDASREHLRQKLSLRDEVARLRAALERAAPPAPTATARDSDQAALLSFLRARCSAVGATFLRDALQWPLDRVTAGLKPLLASGDIETTKLGDLVQFRARRDELRTHGETACRTPGAK